MNYGIQDSINLVWKVAWVRRMQESMSIMDISDTMSKILDSYDVERRSLAHKLIDRTSLGTDIVLSNNTIVQWFRSYMIRNWISYLMVENGGAYALAQLTTEYDPKNADKGSVTLTPTAPPGPTRALNLNISNISKTLFGR